MPNDDVFVPPSADAAEPPKKSRKTKPTDAEAEDLIGSGPTGPVIEDDVPLPTNNAGRKSAFDLSKMPFDKLKVEQSFALTLDGDGKTPDGITPKTVMAQAKKAFPDRTFIMRVAADGLSVRFWRKK